MHDDLLADVFNRRLVTARYNVRNLHEFLLIASVPRAVERHWHSVAFESSLSDQYVGVVWGLLVKSEVEECLVEVGVVWVGCLESVGFLFCLCVLYLGLGALFETEELFHD